jgi:hypothetical protein
MDEGALDGLIAPAWAEKPVPALGGAANPAKG